MVLRRMATLDGLRLGSRAKIAAVAKGPLYQQLLAMGLTPGTEVEAVCRAPFGDPVLYAVRGYRLALRREEAATIVIEETDSQ